MLEKAAGLLSLQSARSAVLCVACVECNCIGHQTVQFFVPVSKVLVIQAVVTNPDMWRCITGVEPPGKRRKTGKLQAEETTAATANASAP